MDILSYFLIALGLSFDSFAVSVSSGVSNARLQFWRACKIAFSLALFQAVFPLIGWFFGSSLRAYVEPVDHWVAFVLLGAIGGKMIYDYYSGNEDDASLDLSALRTLIGVSIATSIDALVVGVSFGLTGSRILLAGFIIGVVTFLAAMIGMLIGKHAGKRLSRQANLLGGIILVGIGVKILIEHTFF